MSASRLDSGNRLFPTQSIVSPNGVFRLIMQTDGNLVLYKNGNAAIWNSGTEGHVPSFAVMQSDGNFVVYDTANHALWSSGTFNNPGAWLLMQDDGNMVIYKYGAVFETHTAISEQPSGPSGPVDLPGADDTGDPDDPDSQEGGDITGGNAVAFGIALILCILFC